MDKKNIKQKIAINLIYNTISFLLREIDRIEDKLDIKDKEEFNKYKSYLQEAASYLDSDDESFED